EEIRCVFFFCSSRRRHTRCLSDWSSDVCSSDLLVVSSGTTPRVSSLFVNMRPIRRDHSNDCRGARTFGRRSSPRAAPYVDQSIEIGRASCRERVYNSVVGVSLYDKTELMDYGLD